MMRSQSALSNRFIDPRILAATNNLQLIARTVVEGFVAGLHRSPYHGFSLEFSEYREYSPGDDIRGVDWKVYGRTDRYFVKKFEGDTNTQVYLLLDCSSSMQFSTGQVSKFDYARFLAAALAYYSTRQSDAVGLITFDSEIRQFREPRSRPGHFLSILHQLEQSETQGRTRICNVLEEFSGLIRKRSLVVLISDFYEEAEPLARALRFFHYRGNDVLLFQILDPAELELPLEGTVTFEDLETGEQLPYSSELSRQDYVAEIGRHIASIRKEARAVRIDHEILKTSEPLDRAMYRYLSSRSRRI